MNTLSKTAMLNKAGIEIIKVRISLRIPRAARTTRRTRKTRNTRTTRNNVGETIRAMRFSKIKPLKKQVIDYISISLAKFRRKI